MLSIRKLGILLEITNLDFEHEGVLNPAVIRHGNIIHLFYRAVAKHNHSTIGYAQLSSPTQISTRFTKPLLQPEYDYESQGLEDPRIVKIDDLYYLTYTAYNGTNALGALAVSKDLMKWTKMGILVPQVTYDEFHELTLTSKTVHEKYHRFNSFHGISNDSRVKIWDKNYVIFPRKINGKFCFFHRIKPDIQIVVSVNSMADLTVAFWKDYLLHFDEYIVLAPKHKHEASYIGSGCPPIETVDGWLIIYHGVHDTIEGYIYSACAALLDLTSPQREIARLPYPLFYPDQPWEIKGEVNNVCFPTGTVLIEQTLYIYYGAADKCIGVVSVNIQDLLNELKKQSHSNLQHEQPHPTLAD
jgi:beta-1,2-mannobiose phosphorylase / 1,2-beta-oligomannan phosphorylase